MSLEISSEEQAVLPLKEEVHARWIDRYREFADLADRIIRENPQRAVLAIPLLRPRHWPPPNQLKVLDQWVRGEVRIPSLRSLLKEWLWSLAFATRDTVSLLLAQWITWPFFSRMKKRPVDLLIKSWGFDCRSLGGADFYFGTLTDQLGDRGLRTLLLIGVGLGRFDPNFGLAVAVFRKSRFGAIPESVLIPWWAPWNVAFQQLSAGIALRRRANEAADPKMQILLAAACRNAVQPGALRSHLSFYWSRRAVRRWKPKVFMSLYEGQPWEQMAWAGVKASDPDCVTVGFQHTVVLPHSLAVLSPPLNSRDPSAPEVVLCLGEATRRMLQPGHARKGTRLVLFGSFRRSSGSWDENSLPNPGRRTVLVLPEGIPEEVKILFHFATRCAAALPDVRFLFRCHPFLPFDLVRPYLEIVPEDFPNIEISREPAILNDFKRASAILYRGSSAVLYGILEGLKPIYLDLGDGPEVDPLFEMGQWRERAGSVQQMEEVLQRYEEASSEDLTRSWQAAYAYVNSYSQPVDEGSIDRFLQALDEARRGS
ncbi:MAG: hypothetical protein HY211_06170 [Candidatus Omnitrophica bacterium]|nr:hypothetical protein [Candidatus Omnitrophota bacterium]